MRRLALCLSALSLGLGPVAGARAGGPVFVVVPTSAQDRSVRHAVAIALTNARHRLAGAARAQTQAQMQLESANAALVHAVDPFAAEGRVAHWREALGARRARVTTLQSAIGRLRLALQPIVLPVGFTSQPTAAKGEYAVQVAERYLGVRYLWGGAAPDTGFDCSGFVKYVYAKLGIDLPHYAASQYAQTRHVSLSQLQAGDLVFFEPRADGPGHVGMYVGDGMFIEAPHTGDVVKLANLTDASNAMGFVGATRPSV
jgi:cell wall-associated NlpC family hydrolase